MTLDEILKPVKFIDEQITTIWYNKIGKKITRERRKVRAGKRRN